MAEKERFAEDIASCKSLFPILANPVFFISLVGVDEFGIVDEDEYIFDIYTKVYDFDGSHVKVVTAQNLWKFYKNTNWYRWNDRRNINIYELVEFFIRYHPNGHFVLDECPFLKFGKYMLVFITRDVETRATLLFQNYSSHPDFIAILYLNI